MAEQPDEPGAELERAREAFHDAEVLLAGDGSDAGVLNRLYYAVFHAAQAVLYARGENPSSHGHVRQQFGQLVVLGGDASREQGRLLGTLYDYRREADYGHGPSSVDLETLIDDVETFVEDMQELVEADESD